MNPYNVLPLFRQGVFHGKNANIHLFCVGRRYISMTKDMTQGSPLKLLLAFAVPLMLGSLFQQFYNLADTIIVGRFVGVEALAAVGSVGGLNYLVLGFVNGIACGFSIPISWTFGAHDHHEMRRYTANTVWLSIAFATVLTIVTVAMTHLVLVWTNTPADIIDLADIYIRTIFAGIPFTLLYNVTSALMRALGDSKRPLYFLLVASVLNIGLDPLLIFVFDLGVAGAAWATILSQGVSALLCLVYMLKKFPILRTGRADWAWHGPMVRRLARMGIPTALSNSVTAIGCMILQVTINGFGSTVVAGSSASANLEGFVYTAMNAFAQAAVTFTSQNMGARRYDNLDRVMRNCLLCSIVTGLVLGGGASLLGEQLLHFYSSDEVVVTAGLARMHIICTTYLLCGGMDVLASCLRGRGYSVLPMVVSLVGSCLLRLVWIATIFQLFHTTTMLYLSYPVSWILTTLVHLACLLVVRHKMNEDLKAAAQR